MWLSNSSVGRKVAILAKAIHTITFFLTLFSRFSFIMRLISMFYSLYFAETKIEVKHASNGLYRGIKSLYPKTTNHYISTL